MSEVHLDGFTTRRTPSGDVALRFNQGYNPLAPEANARLFVTPGSETANNIGQAMTFVADTITEGRSAADLDEGEHITLAHIGIVTTRLRGREFPTTQGRMDKGELAAVFSTPQTSLIVNAMRFALMARAATAADAQDAHIAKAQARLDAATASPVNSRPYQLPEPPVMPIERTPETLRHIAELQNQITELELSRSREQVTVSNEDGRLDVILGGLGLRPTSPITSS